MARKISIPITDHDAEGICATSYSVEYKRTGDINWASKIYSDPPLVVSNLEDDIEYMFRITRNCCDGVLSTALELTVNTTILAAPANFTAPPEDSGVVLTWDAVTGADGYVVERAEDAAFTVSLTTVYTGSSVSYPNSGLTNGTTYYYRVKATAINHADSAYTTVSVTPTAS